VARALVYRDVAKNQGPFRFGFEEKFMTQTNDVQSSSKENVQTEGERPIAPPIAIRKSCSPEGIGLSHYVLMDKGAAK
jgi:modified peptide precursor CbpA